jgi:hypothetical protein
VDAAVEEAVVEETIVEETAVEDTAVDYTIRVDAALEDVTPGDAPVFVPENPDTKADDSWKRIL